MKNKWIYLLMALGATMAFARSLFKEYESFLLIGGMALLMFGIYNISKKLNSKTPPLYPLPEEEAPLSYPHSKIELKTKEENTTTTEKERNEQHKIS
ncbi:hypothetical protein [Capnocytophaga canis]|uniref:hypothetical protein n=1 Tax=Capnocytophaga canis TaxID=1848903 RepID=UPI0015625560|nr:hypothetical protein [Capnocytophaga canis]